MGIGGRNIVTSPCVTRLKAVQTLNDACFSVLPLRRLMKARISLESVARSAHDLGESQALRLSPGKSGGPFPSCLAVSRLFYRDLDLKVHHEPFGSRASVWMLPRIGP